MMTDPHMRALGLKNLKEKQIKIEHYHLFIVYSQQLRSIQIWAISEKQCW